MDSFDITKINISNLPVWQSGDTLEKSKLNAPNEVLRKLGGVAPASQGQGKSLSRTTVRQFKVVEVMTDYVTAVTWDGLEKGTDEFKIALPYLLRRTPFDVLLDDTIEPKTIGDIDVKFEYSSDTEREAINVNDVANLEIQVIVPFYLEDDIIYGMKGIIGATGTKDEDDNVLIWLDTNADGRQWATKTNQDSERVSE